MDEEELEGQNASLVLARGYAGENTDDINLLSCPPGAREKRDDRLRIRKATYQSVALHRYLICRNVRPCWLGVNRNGRGTGGRHNHQDGRAARQPTEWT